MIKTKVRSVNLASDLKNEAVCIAISLVGDRIMHLVPTIVECCLSFSMIGIIKAPVFPLPVLAMAIILNPSRIDGIALLYIGVGRL